MWKHSLWKVLIAASANLVHQDQKRKAQAKLEALLVEGINSDSQEVTPDYWQNLREF